MKIKFNDFYKKGGYSNPFRYFESSTFKQAEEKTEIDAFSEAFGIQKNNSGIPSFLSSNPNENPNLPNEEEEVRNILRSSKNLKEADLYQFSAYKDALDNGAKGVSKEGFFTLVKLKEEYAKSLKELEKQQSKNIVPRSPDPMISKNIAAVTEGTQQYVSNRNLLSPLQKQIDEILKPALEYIQEKNNKAKFSFYKTNPEMEELRKKIGNGGMRFLGTTFNVAETVKDFTIFLNPTLLPLYLVDEVSGTGIRKSEKDLQMKMNTAKLFEKTDYELSYALNKNKTFLSNFIQGGYSGGNDLLTLGIDGIATNVEASKLRNKDPKTYTEEEKHFLNAWDQRQNFESMNLMGNAFGYTLGKGLVQNIGFVIPMGASAKTVGRVGNVVAKLGAVKSGRIANTFWKKANQALYKFLEKSSQVAVGTLMQPMTYDKTLEKYTENIEIVKDKNGNDQYLVDDKTRREYFKEAEKDIAIYLNELQIYQNSLSDPTLPEILRKDLEEKIKYKEAQINSTYSNMSRIAVKNEETGELEPLKDSSLGRSFAYGFMQSGREYFTETIGGDLINKLARGIGRTKPFRRIGVSTKTTNAQINNLLTNAAEGKGIGKLFESLSKHSGIGKIWHGVPGEVGEEVLNQFIPVMDENLLENIKQLGTFNWWRDVVSQTVLMGGVMVAGAKSAEKMSLYSLSAKDREEYLNKVKDDRNYKKELKRALQDILLKANAEIKDKKTADVISMVTHSTVFNEKEAIENLTSLRAKGLNAEADYLQSKLMMNLGLEAFENGLLENYLTSLRKSSSAYKSQIKISPNESDIKGKEKVDKLISSLEQLQKTASKYENKINFDNIVHAAKRKLSAETTLEEFNSQMSKIIKDNAKDFKEYQESLPLDSPLRLADLNSLTINDENSHNLLVELANAGKAEANRLLKLRFFQAMVLSDYNEASKDFAYETNPINYEEIEKRTENERIKAEILRSNTKEKQKKLRRELKQRKPLTPWLNSVLVSQESGNPLSTATIDKIIGLPSLIESVSLLKQEKEIAVSELNITPEVLPKTVSPSGTGEVISEADYTPVDESGPFELFFGGKNLTSPVLDTEEDENSFIDAYVEIIKSHAVSFKRKAKTNSLIHEKDFTFKSFMLELYRSYYKDKPSTLLENFDLFEEAWKKAGVNVESLSIADLVFEELQNEAQGDLMLKAASFLESKTEEKEVPTEEELQEKNNESQEKVEKQETEEIFEESKEIRRAYKIPFLGQFYEAFIDKIKGIITKHDTGVLNEEAFFFLNPKNLPIGKKVQIKLTNNWMNPNTTVSDWEEITSENGRPMSVRKDITMREFVEGLFNNKYKFDQIIKDKNLTEELFKNERFISKVPIDLVVGEETFPGRGLHDIFWWNYETVSNDERERLERATIEAQSQDRILSEQEKDNIRKSAIIAQELKIREAQKKLLALRKALFENKDKKLSMKVSKREIGHILQNPAKIRNGEQVVVENDKKENIVLKEVKSIEESNPTTILCIYTKGGLKTKKGNKDFYIPTKYVSNFEELQRGLSENYKKSMGDGATVMVFQVGTQEVFNEDENRTEIVPKYIASQVYSNAIEAQPFLNSLFETISVIDKAFSYPSTFDSKTLDTLIDEIIRKYGINLRNKEQRDQFRNLFPEKIRKPVTEEELAKNPNARGEVVNALKKDGIYVEKGTPGAIEEKGTPLLRYDIKTKLDRDSKIPIIVFKREDNKPNGKIIGYEITDTISYETALKRGLYTTNRFLQFKDENGEVEYVADSQPIIILSPIDKIEETGETTSTEVYIKETKNDEVEKADPVETEKLLEEAREEVTNVKKGFIVNTLVQETLIDLKTKVNTPLKLSLIYSQMNKSFDRIISELRKVDPIRAQALEENKEEILGYSEYEDSVREQLDAFFGKSQEYSDRIIKKLEKEEEDLGDSRLQESLTPEEVQENEKEEVEGIKKDHSKHSFEQNLSLGLRARTNVLLSGIVDKHPSPFSFGNMKNYYPIGHVISGLQEAFEQAEDNSLPSLHSAIKHIITKTGKLNSEYKFLEDVYNILVDTSTPTELVKEIQFLLYQSQVKMYLAYMEAQEGSFKVTAMIADNKDKQILRRKIWDNIFKQNFNLIDNRGYTYTIKKEEAQRLIDIYNKWKKDFSFVPTKNELKEYLLSFGISLHDKTIEELLKGNKELSYNSLISPRGLVTVMIENLKTLKNKEILDFSKESEHVLFGNNNTNTKKLLELDSKNTFVPASSIYIAGKTVNKYEQPCHATGILKKLNNRDRKTIESLMSCPYTKEAFILKYLMTNEDEKIDISTVSLEALKIKGHKKSTSSKKGATDLSSKDYILTLLGLFAHQGPQVDGRFGTIFNWRTSYLQFPPISDASRVLLLKTIAADLDISNFETISEGNQLIPRKEVFELLYNQLVLPEYRRMVSFIKANKETGFAGYDFGANKFSAVPGLNGIIVKGGKTLLQALHDDLKNTTSPMSEEEIISKYKSEIIFELKEVLNNEAAEFAEYDPETKTIKGSFAENKIYDPLSKNPIQGIDSKYLSSKKGGAASKTIQIVAYDYALNYLLNQSQIQMLFSGDLANFYEDKNRNKFSDANGTVFRTDTKEFMLEVAKFYFPDNYKLQNLIHRYHSTKDESVKERVVQEIEDNFSSEDGHNAILNPTLKDHNAVAKSLYKTFVREKVSPNYFKRLKGILSPGSKLANSKGKQIRQICIKDVKIASQILKELIDTYYPGTYESYSELISEFQTLDNKGEKGEYQERYDELHKMLKKAFPQIQDYLSITSTDAQEFTTWQEFLDEIRDKGRVTMEVYNTIKEKLTKQSEEGYIPNEKYELTNEEMKIIFQPSKPLHAGLYYNNSNGHVAQTFVYIKSSAFPLLPSMTRNFPHLENLRRNLERIEKEEGENTNVRLSYQSANKVGSVRKAAPISLLYEKNLSDAKMQKVRESSLLLDKENYSIQQEKPSDFETQVENNEPVLNTRGTQFEKILLSNGLNKITEKIFPNIFDKEILKVAGLSEKEIKEPNISGVNLYKILNALYKKEQDLLTKQLFRSLNIKRIEDLNGRNIELYESIVEKIKSQLSNYQDKEGLELVYYVKEDGAYIGYTKDQVKRYHLKPEFVDFDFPMWMLPNSRKFESILNSIINKNNVNPKIPGFHTIVGSQEGFKKMSEKDFTKTHGDLNKVGGMYFNPSYDGKLKATRNEEGELVGSQVLISNKFSYVKDGKRYKVDLKEYLKKDEQGNLTNQLDLERLPKEILTHFSFRIPTSAHQSGCLIEIAGFLPDNYGDLMIVPSDYTVQMGEDYDIDARNVYGLNLVEIEKEGVKYLQPESYSILKDLSLNEKEYQERELLVIQNNISNLYKSVYSTTSVDVLKKIREKLSTDTVKETSEMIYEETKQERFNSVYSPSFQMEMLRSGATGKLGIAIHSNFLTLTGLFQQMEHAISFVDLGTNKDGTKIPIPFKMVFGKHLSTEGSLQREKSINEERTVSSYHMENQNTSTDNQKLLYMFKRNENKHTINVLALMTMLGLNKDGFTIDEVEVSYSSLFISQPIIRRYCELMDYYSSETTETYQKIEQLVEDDLIKEFGVGVTWEQGTNAPMVGVLDHSVKMQKETEIDSIALFENLKSSKDNSLQWTVYEHFKTLKGKTKALSAIQKFLNIENKGMGISYFNTIALKDFLSGELDLTGETLNIETIDYYHIQGVKDMIGEFRRVPIKESNTLDKDYIYISSNGETSLFIKPTTYFGHKIVNSISLGYNMWKNLLPYESPYISNIIKDIRRTAEIEEGTEDGLDLKYQIINELKNFSYTSNASLFTDNLEEVRKGLFIDDNTNISLAGYLNYLQKINHPLMRQPFFKQLEMKIGGKDLPSVVIYNATSVSKFEKNEIRKVFKNILDNKEALPADEKGKTYTFESLGKALLQYAMLADQENGAVGFRHMFPMSFFKKYNVTDSVRAIGNPSNVSYHNIFFNGPVKSLELLFGSKLKDGFIANTRRIPFEIVEGYVKKINSMAGKRIAVLEADGVKILEGETEFIHSRFTTQFMQHNPDRATKVDKLFVDALKKSFKVATIAGILKFNYLDTDSNFIQIKEKNKIYLYKRKEGGLFERIPTLGLFGVNEYNFRNSEIDSSIVTENNIPTSGVQQKQALNPQIRALEAPVRTFTLETLLDTIERNNTKYGGLVKIFKKFLDKETKVEIVENLTSGNAKAHGLYDSETNTIKIDKDLLIRNPNLEGEDIRHILEEFIHSLTKKDLDKYLKIRFFEENNKVTMSVEVAKDAPSSVIRLARIYNEAFNKLLAKEGGSQFLLDYLNKRQKISSGDESVTLTQKELVALRTVDINEFIAGIFFDENFRELVGNEPFMESGKSIIQSWAETLLKFLQQIYSTFQEGSIGRETIDALYEFLTEGRKTVPDSFTPVKEEDIFSVTDEDKSKDQQMRDLLRLLDEEATPENNHPEIPTVDNLSIIDTENIVSSEGTKSAAQYDRKNNQIKINRKLLKQKFEEKAWTKPRKLIEVLHGETIESYAQVLPENQFSTYQEWEQFVINHEYQHSLYSREDFNKEFPNKTKGDYESEINKRALNQITPQQKQEAQQVYSQYLDTTTNPTIQGFKEFVNNRTKNSTNKESLQAENLNINKDNIYETLLKEGKIENQGYTLTLKEFEEMTQEEQDNFIKCL